MQTEHNAISKGGPGKSRAVFLVGFMGAGKTTVGRELSSQMHCRFVDLDDVVVEAARKTIPQIFAEEGEKGFRERERLALVMVLQTVKDESTVIALGGGAWVQPEIHEVIRRALIPTVFLDAGVDTLLERCQREGKKRPLAQDENHFRQLYEARRNGYMRAEHSVETAGKSVAAIVMEIIHRLGWSNEIPEVPQSR